MATCTKPTPTKDKHCHFLFESTVSKRYTSFFLNQVVPLICPEDGICTETGWGCRCKYCWDRRSCRLLTWAPAPAQQHQIGIPELKPAGKQFVHWT
mmetsp:Transcript_71204/g.130337  ORF Transcript_71204/g.130337 Transcript_71204/m.130337 type:complete len:96 (+) Transcript_71204:2506-2793(+)